MTNLTTLTVASPVTDQPTVRSDAPGLTIANDQLARILGNAILFATKEECRPALNHILVTVSDDLTLTVEATDSYALIRETWPAGDFAHPMTFMVARKMAEQIVKLARSNRHGLTRISLADDVVSFDVVGSGSVSFPNPNIAWPNTKQLWPTGKPQLSSSVIGLGAWQLARLGKVKRDSGTSLDAARCEFHGELKPCVVTFGPNISVLVMPVRMV